LLRHFVRRHDSRAALIAGRSKPIRMPMIEMTTNSSTRVKPRNTAGINRCRFRPTSRTTPWQDPQYFAGKKQPAISNRPTAMPTTTFPFSPITAKSSMLDHEAGEATEHLPRECKPPEFAGWYKRACERPPAESLVRRVVVRWEWPDRPCSSNQSAISRFNRGNTGQPNCIHTVFSSVYCS
jgi:hypothetical protein